MHRLWRNNSLSIVLLVIFITLFWGQAFCGWQVYIENNREHSQPIISFLEYLGSEHLWEAVFENWESEFLQMGAYVVLTVFLFQKGSAESNDPDESPDQEIATSSPAPHVPASAWRRKLYEHSLSLALFALFAGSFIGHIVSGAKHLNSDRLQHGLSPVTTGDYFASAQFWFESFQNWQSEFLAVLALVVLSIWLREKNSPESKAVEDPHSKTGK
jgi:hypothetical protein